MAVTPSHSACQRGRFTRDTRLKSAPPLSRMSVLIVSGSRSLLHLRNELNAEARWGPCGVNNRFGTKVALDPKALGKHGPGAISRGTSISTGGWQHPAQT